MDSNPRSLCVDDQSVNAGAGSSSEHSLTQQVFIGHLLCAWPVLTPARTVNRTDIVPALMEQTIHIMEQWGDTGV